MQTNADYVVIDRQVLKEHLLDNTNGDPDLIEEWINLNEYNMLTIPEFQKDMVQNSMRWFPDMYKDGINIMALVLGIAGEAGEVADELKKLVRGSSTEADAFKKIAEESVDVFHYLCLLWVALQVDPGVIYAEKTEKNEKRFGKLNGEG